MTARRERILDELGRQGACTYQQLAELLDVSTMTVRRDVDALAKERRVIKTVGGVQDAAAASNWYEIDIRSRMSEQVAAKNVIAALALDLVQEGQTLYLDGSTTCIQLARRLAVHGKGLTIVTNSVFICLELGANRDLVVIGQGGQFDASAGAFVGLASEEGMAGYFVDLAFMSTKGFLPDEGTFESSISTFRVKRIVAGHCARLVLLVDHTKFGQRALSKVLDISQINDVVTDEATPDRYLDELRARQIAVHAPCH